MTILAATIGLLLCGIVAVVIFASWRIRRKAWPVAAFLMAANLLVAVQWFRVLA